MPDYIVAIFACASARVFAHVLVVTFVFKVYTFMSFAISSTLNRLNTYILLSNKNCDISINPNSIDCIPEVLQLLDTVFPVKTVLKKFYSY